MSSDRIDDLVKLFPADISNEVIDFSERSEPGSLPDRMATAMTAAVQAGKTFHMQAQEFQRKVSEALERFADRTDSDGRRVFVLAGDYSQLEMYVLAAMMHESKRGVVLDLEGSGYMPGFDFHPPCELLFKQSGGQIIEAIQPKEPATKQNGRSAAYLALDPTKNTRKRRHGR